MDRKEQLHFCKQCHNQKFDPRQGIICGLTNKPADFEGTCPDFDQKVMEEPITRYGYRSDEPARGGCLTIYIGLIFIGSIIGIVGSLMGVVNTSGYISAIPSWFYVVSILVSISNMLAAGLLYNWKRQGAYLLFAGMIMILFLRIAVGFTDPASFVGVFVGLGIASAVIFPKWEYFS